jgi:rhodanese-related sulfurtransferase
MAAEKLAKLGYDNVRAYEGGLEAWKAAGFATEKM